MGSYIFFRLCRIKHSNFINIIMIFCFGTEVVLGSCMNYFLFESGRKNLLDETNDSEKVLEDCKYYITTFMSYWIIQPIFYTLVIFTRFIFVRYVIKKNDGWYFMILEEIFGLPMPIFLELSNSKLLTSLGFSPDFFPNLNFLCHLYVD